MPFFQNTYYPLHWPVFRTKWLGMPGHTTSMSYPTSGIVFGNMLANSGGIPAFKFQSRRDSVDWRRFSAIDVERVARELDVTTLQENIASVTFCNLDSEKCPHCQQPIDLVLLKVLKMAQLTIEYLLHSQEYLTASMALQEEQLQATLEELKRTKQELDKQAEELKGVKEESRKRKKMIATQQLLLQAGTNNYHKCQLCDKAFMNYSYLQAHIQRRHTEASEAERQKKKQVEQMEDEIQELRMKLKETHTQLEIERGEETQRRVQEAEKVRQREEEGRREFERWKEEERIKFQEEMDSLRQLFLTEFKDIASKNSALEGKLQELQAKNLVASNLGVLRDDDSDDKRQWALTQRELQGMREKTELQKTEWKKKLKELQKEHQMEKEELKSENERLRASLSQDQRIAADRFQQQMGSLNARLKEQTKVIRSQEKTIRILSASKAEVTQETPKVPDLEESSEEDLEDTLNVKQRLLEALRRNPNLLKQFRPILEETLEEKLESMGVKKAAKGIPAQTYKNLSSLVRTQQQQKAKKFPNLLSLRDKLVREVTWKVKQHQKNDDVLPQQLSVVSAKSQRSPLSSCRVTSAHSRVLQAELQLYAKETPKPTPRSKASYSHSPEKVPRVIPQSKASSPRPAAIQQPSTPPFSSEEDSGGDHASLTPVKFEHPVTLQQMQMPLRLTQNDETSSDWSDFDSSEGKASPAIGTAPTGTLVSAMAKKLEHTLSMPAKKPAGGKNLLPDLPSDSPKASHSDKKLQFVDENSDLETSSLEEITQLLDAKSQTKQQRQPAVRHSGDSTGSQGTSIWSSSSTRAGGW
ncbi:cilium assembly protein DZIP1L isoform X2 [Gopherus flavomarginatus]|uniref:cilium assembly protein DZIP1L isoform X2 n=1 Tax=Gopherus flavomarginatus TaxID=286002 RepID=UPI0021CBA488|nr:cilium assembly protein DZIP1L isoform X2 [Gopherus flavomarginatus]